MTSPPCVTAFKGSRGEGNDDDGVYLGRSSKIKLHSREREKMTRCSALLLLPR